MLALKSLTILIFWIFPMAPGHSPLVSSLSSSQGLRTPHAGNAQPGQGAGKSGEAPNVVRSAGRRVYLMGTRCDVTLYTCEPDKALARMESMIRALEKAERELSTWRDASVFSRLNRQPIGVLFPLDAHMCRLFEALQTWTEATGRTFDPAIGALLRLWGIQAGEVRMPSGDLIELARANSGMANYQLDRAACAVKKVGDVLLDTGAFGKGEALDRLTGVDYGDDAWLVDLGGQILVHGLPPGESGWPVEVAHPHRRQEALLKVLLPSGSLATSGGSERDLVEGNQRVGHILDPRSGRPAAFRGSVSVWHENALVADVLSTALYVMGSPQGQAWADEHSLAALFLVTREDGQIETRPSRAFRQRFLNTAGTPASAAGVSDR